MFNIINQQTFTYSKLTIETPEKVVKHVQSYYYRHQMDVNELVLVSLLLTLNIFLTLF